MPRHLLYHLCPIAENGRWQENLDELKKRWHLFDGQKSIAIMTHGLNQRPPKWMRVQTKAGVTKIDYSHLKLDRPEVVREYVNDPTVRYFELMNEPSLREVRSWKPLWRTVQEYHGPDDFTFYAHAKGVTHHFEPDHPVRDWTRLMYETCLDYWPMIQWHLANFPITGTFKHYGDNFMVPGVRSPATWFYGGTFFWVRNSDFFTRPWQEIEQAWWGAESWAGWAYKPEEGGCPLREVHVPVKESPTLYGKELMATVLGEYEAWKRINSHFRTS